MHAGGKVQEAQRESPSRSSIPRSVLVADDRHYDGVVRASGSWNQKVEPSPTALSTPT